MKARRAIIKISDSALMRALHFPQTCKIIGGQMEHGIGGPCLSLVVEDDGLPEVDVSRGNSLPEVLPTITYTPESWSWDWGTSDGPNALPGVGD